MINLKVLRSHLCTIIQSWIKSPLLVHIKFVMMKTLL